MPLITGALKNLHRIAVVKGRGFEPRRKSRQNRGFSR